LDAACLGGFVLPFLHKLGILNKKWDYSVAGVTSISVDVHKYGFGPKGASIITYRNDDYRYIFKHPTNQTKHTHAV
jgi:sphinganine-1-phosphate aldolase